VVVLPPWCQGFAVQSYRIYFKDGAGHFQRVVELECEHDDDALAAVSHYAEGGVMEVWQQDRLVKSYPAEVDRPQSGAVNDAQPSR
jgi:hypothetical protein